MSAAFFYVDGIPTKGKWVELDLVDDIDEVKAELARHGLIPLGEDDEPEYDGDLLVADADDMAKAFLSSSDAFDLDGYIEAREYCESNGVDEDAVTAYVNWIGAWNVNHFEDAYQQQADSEIDFAEQLVDDAGHLDEMPEHLRSYFDYEKFARDIFLSDYTFANGYVFRNC